MEETPVLRRVWLGMAAHCTLFRVQTGKGWVSGGGKPRRLPNGDILVPQGRPIALGLGMINGRPVEGTSDLVGLTHVTITPAMVGQTLPVFTGLEIKRTTGGHASVAQSHFVGMIRGAGGFAAIVNSPEAAQQAYDDFLSQLNRGRDSL